MREMQIDAVAALPELADDALLALGKHLRLERLRRLKSWRICGSCKMHFAARAGALYCSGRCRTAAYRQRLQKQRQILQEVQ